MWLLFDGGCESLHTHVSLASSNVNCCLPTDSVLLFVNARSHVYRVHPFDFLFCLFVQTLSDTHAVSAKTCAYTALFAT